MESQPVSLVAVSPICWYLKSFGASWLVHLPPDQAVWVEAFAGEIDLCSWAIHLVYSQCLYLPRCINRYWQIKCCRYNCDGLAFHPRLRVTSCYRNQRYMYMLQALASQMGQSCTCIFYLILPLPFIIHLGGDKSDKSDRLRGYEKNSLHMFRKSYLARGHDSVCWPKGVWPLRMRMLQWQAVKEFI